MPMEPQTLGLDIVHWTLQVVPVDERMLAAAAREAAERKKQAEKKVA